MSSTLAPFGFIPADHPTGSARAKPYTIASGYGTSLYKYAPLILNTNGTITAGTTAADLIGHFAGVEYVDSTGKPTESNFWPASTVVASGTTPTAYVWDDPDIIYNVQANGSIAQTAIGDQADVVNPTAGSTSTGLSTAALNSTLAGAGVQGQYRIVGFNLDPNNTIGDAYTIVQVQLARSQYVANKVAI